MTRANPTDPNNPRSGMTFIVKTIVRFVGGIIVIFGIYLVLHGHLSPGGGFAGGVILASALVLLMLAYGKDVALKELSHSRASLFESIGALLFLIIALSGFAGGYFFLNVLPKGQPFKIFSAGIIPLCNIAVGIKVSGALFAAFVVLVLVRLKIKKINK